ncbi:hypothetical protein ACFV0A_37410, partial [Streptomyces sp. NPDC059552]
VGSLVRGTSHPPSPATDLLGRPVVCAAGAPGAGQACAVAVGPAGRAELVGRCWKEVRSAWVSHRRP